jgi:hypothetical protein
MVMTPCDIDLQGCHTVLRVLNRTMLEILNHSNCADGTFCRARRLTLAVPLLVMLAHKVLVNADE